MPQPNQITDTHLGEGNKREKYQRNIATITTLQTLERENRPATKEEQAVLSQYVGWGGLPKAFDETKDNWHVEYLQFNLTELMSMFKEVADIKTTNELDLPTLEVVYKTVVAKPTEIQQALVQELSERAAKIHNHRIDPSIDNKLTQLLFYDLSTPKGRPQADKGRRRCN